MNPTPFADKFTYGFSNAIEAYDAWLVERIQETRTSDLPLHSAVAGLDALVQSDGALFMSFTQLLNQQLLNSNETLDYPTMLKILSRIIQEPPVYPYPVPIWILLRYALPSSTGYTVFLDPRVNLHIKCILDARAEMLKSPASCSGLSEEDGGWLSPSALASFEECYDGLKFPEIFECDPETKHWGFKSWDDFFTRRLREGVRPVEFPDDSNVVNSPCESKLHAIVCHVRERDTFWIKSECYSLRDMLSNDDCVKQFIGGTVLQAFLATRDYHRWCSPATGTIAKIVLVPGIYFSQAPDPSSGSNTEPEWARSLSFNAHLNTRMLIFIESDNEHIGMVCFVAVGMQEVSGCEATVKEGDSVVRGQELGAFHYGGSTWCLIFRPECELEFLERYGGEKVNGMGVMIPVRSALAVVRPTSTTVHVV